MVSETQEKYDADRNVYWVGLCRFYRNRHISGPSPVVGWVTVEHDDVRRIDVNRPRRWLVITSGHDRRSKGRTMKQRVLVCDDKDYDDHESLATVLDAAHQANPIECLIHGAARGADKLADEWAQKRGVEIEAYVADWRDGKRAGPMRNQQMLDQGKPHMVIAFPGGKGTADMIRRAEAAKVPVVKVTRALVSRC